MPLLSPPWSRVGRFQVTGSDECPIWHPKPRHDIRRGWGIWLPSHLATTTSLMEARVTTATRRLRRTGVATLAASVAASLALVATAGSAFAALGTIVNKVDPANTATTVYPGQAAQATGGYLLDTTNSFAIGDQIVLKLEGAGIDPSQTNKGVGFATKPALTAGSAVTLAYGTVAAATANGDVVPTFTTALAASNTTAAINDELVV